VSPIAIAVRPHAANRSHGNCARDALESDSAGTIGDLVDSMTASPASPELWSMLTDARLEPEPSGSKRPADAQANPAAAAATAAKTRARRRTHISRDSSGGRTPQPGRRSRPSQIPRSDRKFLSMCWTRVRSEVPRRSSRATLRHREQFRRAQRPLAVINDGAPLRGAQDSSCGCVINPLRPTSRRCDNNSRNLPLGRMGR
jgi:hypothetical protein